MGYLSTMILDCFSKNVTLTMHDVPSVVWQGSISSKPIGSISFVHARRLVASWFLCYLAYVRDVSRKVPLIESIAIVHDTADVFPSNLP